MKKFVALTLSALMMCSSVFAGGISVNLNGENVEFANQAPVIVEGRTLIPLRGVFEKLGYEIGWDAETKSATFTKDNTVVKVTVNANSFTLNGSLVNLDVPAQIVNGSMMLPLRAIGEATGLKVDWDNENKAVNLASDDNKVETTEATTETTTETTTEVTTTTVANKDTTNEKELDAVKSAAKCIVNVYSVLALCNNLKDSESYNMYKLDGGMKYSYSEKEVKKILDDAIAECEKFKTASADIETGSMDSKIVKRFNSFVDTCIQDYKFLRDYYCSDKYDDLTDEQLEAKMKGSINSMISAMDSLVLEMDSSIDKADGVFSSEKYNVPDPDKASSTVKSQKNAYIKEIGTVVNNSTEFIDYYKKATENYYYYEKAAKTIRDKLNNTKTPEFCVLDREIMLACCDLLDKAGKAVSSGAFIEDGKNVALIKFDYCLSTCEILFKEILGDNYTLKYLKEIDDSDKSDNEKELEDKLEGKFV